MGTIAGEIKRVTAYSSVSLDHVNVLTSQKIN